MERKTCPLHNIDIIIYDSDFENLFIDDNRLEVAIFIDTQGKKYIKRCVMGRCDEYCPTIKQILEE